MDGCQDEIVTPKWDIKQRSGTPHVRSNSIQNDQEATSHISQGQVRVSVEEVRLKRDLSFIHTVSLITGIMIGAFIFVTPNYIATRCGSVGLSLIAWISAGLFVLCQALAYTEISLMYPSAGEAFTYYKEVIGPLAGFLYAWFRLVIIGPVFGSTLAMVTAEFLLAPVFPGCMPPVVVSRLLAIVIYGKELSLKEALKCSGSNFLSVH